MSSEHALRHTESFFNIFGICREAAKNMDQKPVHSLFDHEFAFYLQVKEMIPGVAKKAVAP